MSKQEIEPLPGSVQRSVGLILLSIAIVLLPSIITSKRISVQVKKPSISLGRLEPTAEATSIQDLIVDDPVIVPEPVIEPAQAIVEPEVIPTPPPVVQEPVEPSKPVTEAPSAQITGNKLEWLAARNSVRIILGNVESNGKYETISFRDVEISWTPFNLDF